MTAIYGTAVLFLILLSGGFVILRAVVALLYLLFYLCVYRKFPDIDGNKDSDTQE